jgi:hypothetical protein
MKKENDGTRLIAIAEEIAKALKVCREIENIDHADITSLLGYQTELMAQLARVPEWYATVEYEYNIRRAYFLDDAKFGGMPATRLRMLIESRMADEIRLMTLAHETGRTISRLLESLNVKIPTERRLMPNKQ